MIAVAVARDERRHFPCFDGFRAIAALSVLVTHASFVAGANVSHPLGGLFARMDAGVSIFFLISGFLLYRPFVLGHLGARRPPSLAAFFRNRALRIVPAYWVALTVIVFVMGYGEIAGARDAITYYGLLQIYDSERIAGGLGQAWSLCTEISFYAFLPAFAWAVGRAGGRRVGVQLAAVATLFATGLGVRWLVMVDGGVYDNRLAWLPAMLDLFALGMLLAVASAWIEATGRTPRIAAVLGRAPAVWWALAALAFWTVSYRVGLPRGIEPYSRGTGMERQLLYGATGFFLLVPGVFGPERAGAVRRLLCSRVAAFLGLVSYGIYLWHKAFIEVVWEWLDQPIFRIDLGPLLAGTVALTVAVAAASYFAIERPALRLKHGWPKPVRRWAAAALALFAACGGAAAPPASVPTTTTPAQPSHALLLGDSVMWDATPGLEAALRDNGFETVFSDTVLGMGLTKRDYYDWRQKWPALLAEHHPDVVVAHTGGWDVAPQVLGGREVDPTSPEWQAWFTPLADEAMTVLTATGARAYWVGALPYAIPGSPPRTAALNRVLGEAAARHGVTFVDPTDLFDGADGAFARVLPGADGSPELVRKLDGVHLCAAGAVRFATAVTTAMRLTETSWTTGPWRADERYSRRSEGCA